MPFEVESTEVFVSEKEETTGEKSGQQKDSGDGADLDVNGSEAQETSEKVSVMHKNSLFASEHVPNGNSNEGLPGDHEEVPEDVNFLNGKESQADTSADKVRPERLDAQGELMDNNCDHGQSDGEERVSEDEGKERNTSSPVCESDAERKTLACTDALVEVADSSDDPATAANLVPRENLDENAQESSGGSDRNSDVVASDEDMASEKDVHVRASLVSKSDDNKTHDLPEENSSAPGVNGEEKNDKCNTSDLEDPIGEANNDDSKEGEKPEGETKHDAEKEMMDLDVENIVELDNEGEECCVLDKPSDQVEGTVEPDGGQNFTSEEMAMKDKESLIIGMVKMESNENPPIEEGEGSSPVFNEEQDTPPHIHDIAETEGVEEPLPLYGESASPQSCGTDGIEEMNISVNEVEEEGPKVPDDALKEEAEGQPKDVIDYVQSETPPNKSDINEAPASSFLQNEDDTISKDDMGETTCNGEISLVMAGTALQQVEKDLQVESEASDPEPQPETHLDLNAKKSHDAEGSSSVSGDDDIRDVVGMIVTESGGEDSKEENVEQSREVAEDHASQDQMVEEVEDESEEESIFSCKNDDKGEPLPMAGSPTELGQVAVDNNDANSQVAEEGEEISKTNYIAQGTCLLDIGTGSADQPTDEYQTVEGSANVEENWMNVGEDEKEGAVQKTFEECIVVPVELEEEEDKVTMVNKERLHDNKETFRLLDADHKNEESSEADGHHQEKEETALCSNEQNETLDLEKVLSTSSTERYPIEKNEGLVETDNGSSETAVKDQELEASASSSPEANDEILPSEEARAMNLSSCPLESRTEKDVLNDKRTSGKEDVTVQDKEEDGSNSIRDNLPSKEGSDMPLSSLPSASEKTENQLENEIGNEERTCSEVEVNHEEKEEDAFAHPRENQALSQETVNVSTNSPQDPSGINVLEAAAGYENETSSRMAEIRQQEEEETKVTSLRESEAILGQEVKASLSPPSSDPADSPSPAASDRTEGKASLLDVPFVSSNQEFSDEPCGQEEIIDPEAGAQRNDEQKCPATASESQRSKLAKRVKIAVFVGVAAAIIATILIFAL